MEFLNYLLVGGTGLLAGSFLNVVSDRLFQKKDFVRGRSKCDHCHKTLGAWDLIPVLSFILSGGKCRYCHKKLDVLYPISEILTSAVFVFLYYVILTKNLDASFIPYYLIAFSLFIIIFLSDYKYYEVPFGVVVSGTVLSTLYRYLVLGNLNYDNLFIELASTLGIGLFFFLIIYLSKGGMGGGDLKLSFFISLFLGFPKNVFAIYYAFVIGGIFALILLVLGKKGYKAKIPFGPFMVIGVLVSLFLY
jgi:prepilin signal peptidase PulO-like enzyme (type II secretory pathway)